MNEEHWKDVDANYFRWRRILTMQLKTGRMTDNHSLREADQQKRALLLRQHRDNPRGHELILMRERTREPREIQSQIDWLKLSPPTIILKVKGMIAFLTHEKSTARDILRWLAKHILTLPDRIFTFLNRQELLSPFGCRAFYQYLIWDF